MTRFPNLATFTTSDLDTIRNYSIGIDRLFNQLATTGRTESKYPPYNIAKKGDDTYVIEIAVAGFNEEDLDVTLHDGQLTITGEKKTDDIYSEYVVKGIGLRNFTKTFSLVDTIEVEEVYLDNGLLKIVLGNIIPDHKKPVKFQIGKTSDKQLLTE